jgi:Holliday junction resolvase
MKEEKKLYTMETQKFESKFGQKPWLGMIIKTKASRFFVIEEIKKRETLQHVYARELAWYEITGIAPVVNLPVYA